MASSSVRKQCASNNGCKQVAVANCEGCSKAFCIKHFTDHRHLLEEEMNVIIDEHDYLKNSLNHQTINCDSHPFIKKINKWEEESIVKIQRRAKELRQEVIQSTSTHANGLSKELEQLSERLKRGREQDDFIEADLQLWKETLKSIKTNLNSQSKFSINQNNNISLVQDISINFFVTPKEKFALASTDTVRIEENDLVVIHDEQDNHVEIRGQNEYASGSHRIRLRIEETTNAWMLLGINSKITPLRRLSYDSTSTYGWSSNARVWSNGRQNKNNSIDIIAMKKNDIINLILDCDKQTIMIANERTNTQNELTIDINRCPFPWQLHINLYEANSRVRIL